MRLELHMVRIKETAFGDKTRIENSVLSISRAELETLLEKDPCFERVEIELARPGESCRICQVADVIEPRAKKRPQGEGDNGYAAIGQGETCVLKGAAIALVDCRPQKGGSVSAGPRGDMIDMSGPGSEISIYGKTINVVLLPHPKEGVNPLAYQAALKFAGLKAADYLAQATANQPADEVEIYELAALRHMADSMAQLPKIAYIFQILSLQFEPIPDDPTLFGKQAGGIIPTILHPNQILDGAVTSALPGLNVQTYVIQNHPIIKELYQRHGKDLCFSGVIITTAPNNVFDIDRMADIAASQAKWVLGADGVILTKTGGGAPELAMARTAQRCEQIGIKTAIAMLHMGADFKDAKFGATTIFNMPEVDAIVSMGGPFTEITLEPAKRVIGDFGSLPTELPADSGMAQGLGAIKGAMCQLGSSRLKAVRY